MAVAVQSKPGFLGAGRSKEVDFATGYVSPFPYNNTSTFGGRVGSNKRPTLLTSSKSLGDASSVGTSLGFPNKQTRSRTGLRHIDTNMTSYTTTATIPPSTTRSDSRLAKLHKRASSGSSLPASPLSANQSQFTTPYATYEESRPSISSTTSGNTSFKSRPYIRKLSSAKDDVNQGRLDLSKSTSEAGYLPGLGIQDYGARTVSEVTFSHTKRVAPHTRTTSGGSQISVSSRSFTPTQPFIHPMRQTPYTPSGQSYASSMTADDEAHESSDIVTEDDISISHNFRNRRSVSISSTPQIQPTPLSQAHSAADLDIVRRHNTSQSNVSIRSGKSAKSSKSRLGRPRRNTERSEHGGTSSSRPSMDKAFSFVSRRSTTETDPLTRDERIREKRRQFNEKEASKERKKEILDLKRRETNELKEEKLRRKSDAEQVERVRSGKISSVRKVGKGGEKKEELKARSYDDTRPAQLTALPRARPAGREGGWSEKTPRSTRAADASPGTWPRFSTWLQTRLLSCGEKG